MSHSLLSDTEATHSEENTTEMIDPSLIRIDPCHPIVKIPEEEFRQLISAIRSESNSHPLKVQRLAGTSTFRLLSEEKHFRAYLYCRPQKIPCIIQDHAKEPPNRTLPKNYFEEADLIHALFADENVSEEEIASFFQVSADRCRERMLLHNFKDTERKIILRSRISMDAAICLYHLSKKEKYTVYHAMANEGIHGKMAEEMIFHLSHSKAKILIKSIGLFYNSIDKAIKTMNQSGIPVKAIREDHISHTCITIMIPNTDEQATSEPVRLNPPQMFHVEH